MKKLFTKSLFLLFFLTLYSPFGHSQPANDNVCDAMPIILDAAPAVVNNVGATVESGENDIVPPTFVDCSPGGWCDQSHPNGGAGMDNSLWFSFVAPATTSVLINLCGSTFDTQLALYDVGDCSDFSTFDMIWASDDEAACGMDNLSSTIRMECLEEGKEYFFVVDGWQNSGDSAIIEGDVVVEVQEVMKIEPAIDCGIPVFQEPICPGGNEGSIDIDLLNGVRPISYQWSTGDTTQDLSNLTEGFYEVTVTDFCGTSQILSIELEDPTEVQEVVFDEREYEVIHPRHCGTGAPRGQISAFIKEGYSPYSYQWSTGDSTAVLTDLTDGTYTVTVTEFCGLESEEKTFYLGATAGPDVYINTFCGDPLPIGIDHTGMGGESIVYECNQDTLITNGVMCVNGLNNQGPTAYWKSYDLANDYGATGEQNLDGFQLFIRSFPNFEESNSLPIKASVYIASTPFLDDPNLQLILLDSIFIDVPEITSYTPYFIPLKGIGLGPNDILALKVETLFPASTEHRFDFGVNEIAGIRPTYLTSEFCDIDLPTTMADLGFNNNLISRIFLFNNSGVFTYQWDGPVDDPTSPTPNAMPTGQVTTYTVTITDQACGTSIVDEMTVFCLIDGTDDLTEASFTISPNPSDGFLFLKNEGLQKDFELQVYNVQGKLLHRENLEVPPGANQQVDLSALASGMYLLKIQKEEGSEVHRVVVN